MPEARYFTVTQTRKVKVIAHTAEDAIRIAEAAFVNGQYTSDPAVKDGPPGVWGNTRSMVREIEINCKEQT